MTVHHQHRIIFSLEPDVSTIATALMFDHHPPFYFEFKKAISYEELKIMSSFSK
jgi:hypothetical protein